MAKIPFPNYDNNFGTGNFWFLSDSDLYYNNGYFIKNVWVSPIVTSGDKKMSTLKFLHP